MFPAVCARSLFTWTPALFTLKKLHIGVVEAPFNKGQKKKGVEDGPKTIRDTGVFNTIQNLGSTVREYGVVEMREGEQHTAGPSGEHNHSVVLNYNARLAATVSKVITEGGLCVTLGGDHSIGIGTVSGHSQANPHNQVVLLWVDAHADLNTGSTSPSGNMHGMPVAYHLKELARRGVNRLPNSWPQPRLSARHLAYIGLRDLDDGEVKFLEELGILAFGMRDLDAVGLNNAICRCLDHLQPGASRPLHLSFDIDSLDPLEAPSTGTPVRGGLSLREGLQITEAVRETGHLRCMDIVEVNPHLGNPDDAVLTANAARLILLSALHGYRGA
ncbi:arginase, hepatic [Cherax quadricarinatus]|nr:arginase, hepatic-like [Cherax quadricarinatus]